MNKKKKIQWVAAGILLCFLLFGCSGEKSMTVKSKVKLTLWHYWDIPRNQKQLNSLINQFNESQDCIEIKTVYIPDEDFKKKLALAMAEGNTPDLALVDSSDFRFFHGMQPFVELTDQIPELSFYMEQAIEPCEIDNKIYGQPFGVNCTAMFYNKRILEAAGCTPPQNWEEFKEVVEKVSTRERNAFAIAALQTEESMYSFLPILWSMGGEVTEINGEQSRKAFQMLGEMAEEGSLSRQSISLTLSDVTNQFVKGNIAIMFNNAMQIDCIREQAPNMEFGVCPIPGETCQVSVLGGEILAVTDQENQEEAIKFLRFLADKHRMESYLDGMGLIAPRVDVMEQQFQGDEWKEVFMKILPSARLREMSEEWPQISLEISSALSQVIAGDEEIESLLENAEINIEKIREEQP